MKEGNSVFILENTVRSRSFLGSDIRPLQPTVSVTCIQPLLLGNTGIKDSHVSDLCSTRGTAKIPVS